MFFSQSQAVYLEVSFLRSNIVSLNPMNETILSIESEVLTRIVTAKAVEDCTDEKAADMLVRQNILATDKDGVSLLGLRQSYRWVQGATAATLMREARFIIEEHPAERAYQQAASITAIPAITILSIVTHNAKKRPRE